jgi:hypothetical protein
MKQLVLIILFATVIYSCVKDEGEIYTTLRSPVEEVTVKSNKGSYLYLLAREDSAITILEDKAIVEGEFIDVTPDSATVVIQHGHCWSRHDSPTLNDFHSEKGAWSPNDPDFTSNIGELEIATVYYFRSYLITKKDTGYNPRVEKFTTPMLENVWRERRNIFTVGRQDAVVFTIGKKAYIGTGHDGTELKEDFWEYDFDNDSWSQITIVPGGKRTEAVGFAINGYGYIGTGLTYSGIKNDFWRYNPDANEWDRISDFTGGIRKNAIGFAIREKGYVGTGEFGDDHILQNDFWAYNPNDEGTPKPPWQKMQDFAGGKRRNIVGFAIGDKGYVGTGDDANGGNYFDDFWRYDPINDAWTPRSNFEGGVRTNATGFAINNTGYISTGKDTLEVFHRDLWKYNPFEDNWTKKADFGGTRRINAVGFSLVFDTIARGYIGTGFDIDNEPKKDLWEYLPDALND